MTITADELVKILQFFKDALPSLSETAIINRLTQMEARIVTPIETLTQEVAENKEVMASAVILLNGLNQRLKDALEDPAKLAALSADLDANTNALAQAVADNTAVVTA